MIKIQQHKFIWKDGVPSYAAESFRAGPASGMAGAGPKGLSARVLFLAVS